MAIGPMTTNGAAPATTDTTFKTPGVPADAKAVGDELAKKADEQEVENALANKSPTNHTHDLSALINTLSAGTTTPQDADYYVSQYAGGGDTTITYHRRPMSALWAYIKGKADAVFAAKSHTHNYAGSGSAGGSANSAVKLDTSAGSATKPVYFSGGKPAACTYSLGKDVPSNAVFTDHTYTNMTAATASAAGKAGLVPAPAAGAQSKFLRGDGTWQAVYTKAEADATTKTLQTQISKAGGNVGQAIVVYAFQLTLSQGASWNASGHTFSMKIPSSVDFLTVRYSEASLSEEITLLRGQSYPDLSGVTLTFATDGTFSGKNTSSNGVWMPVTGYHRVRQTEGTIIPYALGSQYLRSTKNNCKELVSTNYTSADYVLLKWYTTKTGSNESNISVTVENSILLTRGAEIDEFLCFTTDGKISVWTSSAGSFSATAVFYSNITADAFSAKLTSLQAAQSDTDAMVVDHEYRMAMLELGIIDTDAETT